jgi:hypothetical protein
MKTFSTAVLAVCTLFSGALFAQSPASTPAKAATTSAESPEIRELQKVEDAWSDALNKRDQYGLELVLSPLFVDVSAAGDISTRNQQIVGLIKQEDKTASIDQRVITVRMLGDVAVANGTYAFTHKLGNNMVEDRGVFTHVFQKQHGNWVCLNAQRTLIREETPGKSKSKAKAESKSELPFHIPLFSKGDKSDKTGPSDQTKP